MEMEVFIHWEKRWPRSFGFKLSFASAILDFIKWLKERLIQLYEVKGYSHKGDGVLSLGYVKGDSKKLFYTMYYNKDVLCLTRKYKKIKTALKQDDLFDVPYLQKHQNMPD